MPIGADGQGEGQLDGHRSQAVIPGTARVSSESRLVAAGVGGSLVGMLLQLWAVLGERRSLLAPDSANLFYEAQARAWLDGRWDVPAEVLGPEAISFDGVHSFGYFGPFPALLRLPVVLLTERFDGRLGGISVLLAALVTAAATLRLYLEIRRILRRDAPAGSYEAFLVAVWVASVLGGSTLLFLSSRTFMYHEAILWGVALTTATLAVIVRAARTGHVSVLLLMTCLGGAALARVATVAGVVALAALVGLMLLVPGLPRRAKPTGLALLVGPMFAVSTYMGVNFAKFDTPISVPFEAHQGTKSTPGRLERYLEHGMLGVQYIPTNLLQYLRPDGVGYTDVVPWVTFPNRPQLIIGDVPLDGIEPSGSITASMPLFAVLAGIGLVAGVRRKRAEGVLALGAVLVASGFLVTAAAAGTTHRYLGDAVPPLVFASALGVHRLADCTPRRRGGAVALVACLAVWGVIVNAAFGVLYQRSLSPAFARFQRDVRASVGGRFPVLRLAPNSNVPALKNGQFAVVGPCDALYLDNGIWTVPVDRGPAGGEFEVTLRLAPAPPGTREPIVGAGAPGAVDLLFVEHLADGRVRMAYKHGGHETVDAGPAIPLDGRPLTLHVVFDRTLSAVYVQRGEEHLLATRPAMFPPNGNPLFFGVSDANARQRMSFRGTFLAPVPVSASGCEAFTRELDG